ncbi:MAG: chemotaxis protein CheW [Brevinematales bacterium]|nr:chemotaxis protein CheW [Brevinematales bacterium]
MEKEILNKRVEKEEEKVKRNILFNAIIFKLDKSFFAININYLQEIIFFKTIYRVPNTAKELLGVINLRGNIVPVFSLKSILEENDEIKHTNKIFDEEKLILILKDKKDVFGLVVDGIYKNVSVTDEKYRNQDVINKWVKNYLFEGIILEDEREIFTLSLSGILDYISVIKQESKYKEVK